jgi:hypothetical protein
MLHWNLLGKNCILADFALHPGCGATGIPSVPARNVPSLVGLVELWGASRFSQ